MFDYARDAHAIYRQSFAIIRAEADLTRFPADLEPLVVRVIHACGMTDIAEDLLFSPEAGTAGRAALAAGAPIWCDSRMVAEGIVRARLPAANPVRCMLDDPQVPALAHTLVTTRSAAAVDLWRPALAGAVAVIGNAPTALFRLLELLDAGAPRPALILGFPVGFVGAAESPFADPVEFRPYRLAKKVKAGANFIQTQLVYDLEAFERFMGKVRELGLHEQVYILAGVGPLKSPGMARYMKDSVPGILVPDELIARMDKAGAPWAHIKKDDLTKEDKKARSQAWQEEGIRICIELIQQIRAVKGVAGVHIMAIEWEEAVKTIVEGAGLYPRPVVKEEQAIEAV